MKSYEIIQGERGSLRGATIINDYWGFYDV